MRAARKLGDVPGLQEQRCFAEELRTAEESATVLRKVVLRSVTLAVPRVN